MNNRLLILMRQFSMRYSQREQLLLLLCAVLVMFTLLWVLLWQPVMAARTASEARLSYAATAFDEVNRLAAELEYLRQSDVTANQTGAAVQALPQAINSLSARTGLTVAALEPAADNRSAGLRFDAVSMPALLNWLAELEKLDGMQLEQLHVAPLGNNPAADNVVNASLQIRSVP